MARLGTLPGPHQVGRLLCGGHTALALDRGGLHHRTAQCLAQLPDIDLIPVAPHNIHHIQRNHDGNPHFGQLRGQIEIAFDIGGVHQIQNGVRPLLHQIIPGNHFLQRIGGERIDARQIGNGHILAAFQLSLFLFHRDTGPVSYKLIGPGKTVEQRGLSAVGITGQSNFD